MTLQREGGPKWIQPYSWERPINDHLVANKFKELSKKNTKNGLTKKDNGLTCHVGDQSLQKYMRLGMYNLFVNDNLFKFLTNAGERHGKPLPWLVLFDHTHHKNEGKDPYVDKKFEVMAVRIDIKHIMLL